MSNRFRILIFVSILLFLTKFLGCCAIGAAIGEITGVADGVEAEFHRVSPLGEMVSWPAAE